MRLSMLVGLLLGAELCVPLACAQDAAAAAAWTPFADGARYAAIGDSITHGGWYVHFLQFFYLTRYPERRIAFINCGSNGEAAWQVPKRYAFDIAATKPTVATVLYGMNDGGLTNYTGAADSPEMAANKARAVVKYAASVRDLLACLRRDGVKAVLVSPTIYEESPQLAWENHPAYNAALGAIAARAREIATAEGIPFIDLHVPLERIDRERQSVDPKFTIVGMDRVHPGAIGHLVIAYLMLAAQGVRAEVASVSISADGTGQQCDHCRVDHVTPSATGIAFDYLPDAVPFAVDAWIAPAFKLVPFAKDLDQETMRIVGLAEGSYELRIDGAVIRTYTAGELAAGIDLSEEKTPQRTQALKGWAAYKAIIDDYVKLRDLSVAERSIVDPATPRPLTSEALRTITDTYLSAFVGTGGEAKARGAVDKLLELKRREEDRRTTIETTLAQVRDLVRPRQRRISFVRVP